MHLTKSASIVCYSICQSELREKNAGNMPPQITYEIYN